MSKSKVLFMMSGSIAAFKACQVISRLVQTGDEVRVAATRSALQFIGPATLEGLTGQPVLSDLWEAGRAMDHIHWTRWADVAVLCPASANTIARLAGGLADDVVGAMALAWPTAKRFWIIPAMNHQMYAAAATQDNLATLAARGFSVAPTQNGALACGEEGEGRMLEAEAILTLLRNPPRGDVLVTGGATREPIDGIRFLSNVSTGQTAARLCELLSTQGWNVTYLHGEGAIRPSSAKCMAFSSFADLDQKLRRELGTGEFRGVIHAAAVSDFSPEGAQPAVKLTSSEPLTLRLKPNFKILPRLKEYSRHKDLRVIGFKLTLHEDAAAVARDMLGPAIDAVVANEWQAVQADRSVHPGAFVRPGVPDRNFTNLEQLAALIDSFLDKGETHDSLS